MKKTYMKVRYTYDTVTEESAEFGEAADSGWFVPGLGRFPTDDDTAAEYTPLPARDAVAELADVVGYVEHVQGHGDRLTVYGEARNDYRTGESETICAHITGNPRMLRALKRTLEVTK